MCEAQAASVYRRRGAAQISSSSPHVRRRHPALSRRVHQGAEEAAGRRGQRVSELLALPQAVARDLFELVPPAREIVVVRDQEQRLDLPS